MQVGSTHCEPELLIFSSRCSLNLPDSIGDTRAQNPVLLITSDEYVPRSRFVQVLVFCTRTHHTQHVSSTTQHTSPSTTSHQSLPVYHVLHTLPPLLPPRPTTPTPPLLPLTTQPPIILIRKPIMQRLNPFLPLPLTQLITRGDLEKRWRRLDKPLRLNHRNHVHVFPRRLHKTVIHDVLGCFAEECR